MKKCEIFQEICAKERPSQSGPAYLSGGDSILRLLALFGPAGGYDNFGSVAQNESLLFEYEHAASHLLFLNADILFFISIEAETEKFFPLLFG